MSNGELTRLSIDQAAILAPLLKDWGITKNNLGYFVFDSASNNDTTLRELAKSIEFDPAQKRLRCMGHIINLIAEAYLFGQDASTYNEAFKKAGPGERRKLWRQRGELGKLHNLIAHVIASGKRTELFEALQRDANEGIASGRVWKLVLDGGIRWNSSYSMIRRALELREALELYQSKLRGAADAYDLETYNDDFLLPHEWDTLALIKDHLEPLFRLTKALEGNATLKDGAKKASHGALWEVLPVFEHPLSHFESLEKDAKAGKFQGHSGIQSSITLAWEATIKWYRKTDLSIAWVAGLVLHPRFKYQWFDGKWTSSGEANSLKKHKTAIKQHWERNYKSSDGQSRLSASPEPPPQISYLEEVLNSQAPSHQPRPTAGTRRQDEWFQYIDEPTNGLIGILDYWKIKESEWPQLARMAYDFLSIPAMSSECERVFSSCGKQTTVESSRLSGTYLWYSECLKNWQRRGAINMGVYRNATVLDFDGI